MSTTLRIGFAIALILGSSAALSADQAKLTPQDIAEGWILLFDGLSTFGWKTTGDVRVENGVIILGGKQASSIETTSSFLAATIMAEYKLNATLRNGSKPDLLFHGCAVGSSELPPLNQFMAARIECTPQGKMQSILIAEPRKWLESCEPSPFKASPIRFAVDAGTSISIRKVVLKPDGMKPIFNGKDLSGWHVLPGYKSVFSVTPQGWLHLQNGKGDLQTESTWADFILQLECKTNGDRLNSGVFLRCQPKQYQQGYEAQIHNGFGAPKDYTISHYDPKTHQLLRTEKIKNTSLDFGTGSIYRRQPARFQAAKDRDWFGMTVLAEGNHFATWVNGIQMCDWDDNRPPSDNGRSGYRAEAGHISLQGHDPTTDIDFRNLRIENLDGSSKK